MKEETAENKLLRLLKESRIEKGTKVSSSPPPPGSPNKLLDLLRTKHHDDLHRLGDDPTLRDPIRVPASPKPAPVAKEPVARPVVLSAAPPAAGENPARGDRGKAPRAAAGPLSVLQLYVFVTREEILLLEKLTQEASSFDTLLALIFGHNLMAREIPSEAEHDLSRNLVAYVRQQNALLHRLLVKARLGQEVDLGRMSTPDHDLLQTTLMEGLLQAMRNGKETRVPSLSVEEGRLILVASLTPERVRFFQKLSQERRALGMVLHLFFSHVLMAREMVVQSAGQLQKAFAVNELLARYREGEDALLNRLLLSARMQRPINLKEEATEQRDLVRAILEKFRQLV